MPWLTVPAGLAAIVTGGLLSLGTRYGLTKYWWLVIKILIAAIVVTTDGTLTGELAHAAAVNHTSGPVLCGSTTAYRRPRARVRAFGVQAARPNPVEQDKIATQHDW